MKALDEFDLVIVGAGISGLGVALEAIKKGKMVCIIDKNNAGQGTSNNSLRIIHGGLRYLQKLDFKRIVYSVTDQTYCLANWPEIIKPLRCVAPLSGKGLKRTSLARLATVLYSCFLGSLDSKLERPYVDQRQFLEELPFLAELAPAGFLIWQDALLINHQALVTSMMNFLKREKTLILENSKVTELNEKKDFVEVIYQSKEGVTSRIYGKKVVNCSGAWVNQLSKNIFLTNWSLAFNIILKRQFSPDIAFAADGDEGRYFFFVPRENKTVLGTSYAEFKGDPDFAVPSDFQVANFMSQAAKAVPGLELSESDIDSVEHGILPVKCMRQNGDPVFYGSGLIKIEGRVVHLLSTKYTTFRSQARDILKTLDRIR